MFLLNAFLLHTLSRLSARAMKWNHAAGTDCFSRSRREESLRDGLTAKIPRAEAPSIAGTGGKSILFGLDRCSLFKLIRTCLCNN